MKKTEKLALTMRRLQRIDGLVRDYKMRLAERLKRTRKLFGTRVCAVDLHSHSNFSDGASTVEENCERAKLAGIDFLFATDHGQIRQKRPALKCRWASWGEESRADSNHIGMLHPRQVHDVVEGETVAVGIERARRLAPFVWAAHPAGFSKPSPKQMAKWAADLSAVDNLAMEVLNGFAVSDRAYHRTGPWGVELLDRLLCAGRHVTPLGVSDTHVMVEIGNSWTGVFASRCAAPSIIKALAAGCCFASESSLVHLACNGKAMGSTLKKRNGSALTLRFRVADSAGIAWVRIVSRGRVIKTWDAKGKTVLDGTLGRKASAKPTYYRLESAATDNRRAFSSPLYIEG